MRIVFFTRHGFERDESFQYRFAWVASKFPDVYVVAVDPASSGTKGRMQRRWRKMKRLGLLTTLEIASSYLVQMIFSRRRREATREMLRQLERPAYSLNLNQVIRVRTINGPDAVHAIRSLEPDVIIQAGAGILRPEIFTLARVATINLHHGIAPLIKGVDSIHWALWSDRPEWIGSTVHRIDDGIDTGEVLSYAPVSAAFEGEGFVPLYVRAMREGVQGLVAALERLQAGERWALDCPPGEHCYRSTFSGWRQLILAIKLTYRRSRWKRRRDVVA